MTDWGGLVTVDELAQRMAEPGLRILDCRHQLTDPSAGPRAYEQGHIPGAVHAHIDFDLSGQVGPTTGRHPLPRPSDFREACSRWGIDASTQVVVYDDAGGIWGARAWWLLKDYGHAAVAVLDGGIPAWLRSGKPVSTEVPNVPRTRFTGEPGHMPQVTAEEILQRRSAGRYLLLDARAPERYRGDVEPIDPVAGHIPGARNLPASSLVGSDGRVLPPEELARRIDKEASAHASETPVAYCGSGVTSCHLVLASYLTGRPPFALYPGSWSEWIRDPRRPVERADPSRT